jgi:acyl carrier protein
MDVQQTVRQYICERYLMPGEAESLTDDDDLLTLLDSLQIVRMLMELESRYGIRVDNSELTPENLGSIRGIAQFIQRKQSQSDHSQA